MSVANWRSQAVFGKSDNNGNVRLTPEAINTFFPTLKDAFEVNAQSVAIQTKAEMKLPSSQAITLTRNGKNTTVTDSSMTVSPGDIITLGSSQLIKFIPF